MSSLPHHFFLFFPSAGQKIIFECAVNRRDGNQLCPLPTESFQRTIQVGALHGGADRITSDMSIGDQPIYRGNGVSAQPDHFGFFRYPDRKSLTTPSPRSSPL